VAHRAHASVEGIGHRLPIYAGRTMQDELEALTNVLQTPVRPLAAIVGGAKVSTKVDLLGNLLAKVDTLIIGGGMANTFLAARGHTVGKSLCERDLLPTAREIMAKAKARGRELVLPVDAVGAKRSRRTRPRARSRWMAWAAGRWCWSSARAASSMSAPCSPGSRRWCGTGRSAPSSSSLSTSARSRSPKPRRNSPPPGRLLRWQAAVTRSRRSMLPARPGGSPMSRPGGAFLEWLEGKPLTGVEVLRVR